MTENYDNLSDDDLIDLLIHKQTLQKDRALDGRKPSERRRIFLAGGVGYTQDGGLPKLGGIVAGIEADPVAQPMTSLVDPQPKNQDAPHLGGNILVNIQPDLFDLALHNPSTGLSSPGKSPPPRPARRGRTTNKREASKSEMRGGIASLEHLFAIAKALTRYLDGLPVTDDTICERLRTEILAGGDPLGEYYMRLCSQDARRKTGVTLTPFRIVNSMTKWATKQIATDRAPPVRILDPGAGTGRFAIAAAGSFPASEIFAVESDPTLAQLMRLNLRVLALSDRVRVLVSDFRTVDLPLVAGRTLYIGNPPYVRHHQISREWKEWYSATCAQNGIAASQLAGLHLHFFAKVAELSRRGDYGCFITSAEWLDVGYGSALRALLANGLGGSELHVLEPAAQAFPGTMTTAAITTFFVGERPDLFRVSRAAEPADLDRLEGGTPVTWERAAAAPRWSVFVRGNSSLRPGSIELGELCRVHRGQVTGANQIWIAGVHTRRLPSAVLKPTITSAVEIITAAPILDDDSHLARVIDLPADLDSLSEPDRDRIERFILWAKSAGAADSYIARHRKPWWAVRLADPPPIVCTYMARRAPAFARNRAGARLLNIAHGIYPRDHLSEDQLLALVEILRSTVDQSGGRTYAGGLTKFEPRELERVPINWPGVHG